MARQAVEQRDFVRHLTQMAIVDVGLEARVFQVRDPQDQENPDGLKALKVYSRTWSEDYFETEVDRYSQLKHENLVRFFKAYMNTRLVTERFMLLEFCEGGNLRQKIAEQRTRNEHFDHVQRNRWLKELITALEYLHSKDLVHRDVHPRNILFKGDKIKLGDFRYLRRVEEESNIRPRGSLRYTSPELVQSIMAPEAVNERQSVEVDIWSFGCILYELVTMIKLFGQNGDLPIMQAILDTNQDNLPRIHTENTEIDALYLRTLARQSRDRPSSSEILEFFQNV